MEGPNATYNIPLTVRLRGALQVEALESAIGAVVERHESLRTVFPERSGTPRQEILDVAVSRPKLEIQTVSAEELEGLLNESVRQGFDLSREIPLRVHLFRLGAEEHVLLLVMHHIASDGWSMGPLARDIGQAYAAYLQGGVPPVDTATSAVCRLCVVAA